MSMANPDTCPHGQSAGRCVVCGKERKLSSPFPELRLQATRNHIPGLVSSEDAWGKGGVSEPTVGPNRDFLQETGASAKAEAKEAMLGGRSGMSTERAAKMLGSVIGPPRK